MVANAEASKYPQRFTEGRVGHRVRGVGRLHPPPHSKASARQIQDWVYRLRYSLNELFFFKLRHYDFKFMLKKTTPETDDDIFVDADDATQEQFYAMLDHAQEGMRNCLKTQADYDIMMALCSRCNFNTPTEGLSLIRAMQQKISKAIGITNRSFQKKCEKEGLRILNLKTLKVVLINQERMNPATRKWVREYEDYERAGCA